MRISGGSRLPRASPPARQSADKPRPARGVITPSPFQVERLPLPAPQSLFAMARTSSGVVLAMIAGQAPGLKDVTTSVKRTSLEARGPALPVRVVHVITNLDVGGAETTLARLIAVNDRSRIWNAVIALGDAGPVGDLIEAAGCEVFALGMRGGRLNLKAAWRLVALLRCLKPDIVQTWLYHADLAGLFAASLAGISTVTWNLRCAELDPRDHSRVTTGLVRFLALVSGRPAAVICNSEAGRRAHERAGYHPRRWVHIPNGFDTATFRPDFAAREELRRALDATKDVLVVGLMARLHPMKDHPIFIESAAVVARTYQNAHFVAAGRGVPESENLRRLIIEHGLQQKFHLLGEQSHPAGFLAGCDVVVSASYGEAFPNVVGEAMACGVPCVVTDVGDSSALVGDAGLVVPPRDPQALAQGVLTLLQMETAARERMGSAGRTRIAERFSLKRSSDRYQQLYVELAGAEHRGPV